MLTKDYCDFETAKLLKEKGFDIPCDNCYDSSGKTPSESVYGGANIETLNYNADPFVKSGFLKFKTFSAPTLQMAMKWLREVHKLFIEIEVGVGAFTYSVVDMTNGNCVVRVGAVVGSFEDTLNTAIKDVLENLI